MIGKLIGNYQITGELAQGRLGPIYRGQSVDQTREVVIKTINLTVFPASTQTQLKARFRREVFVQRQLQHPNIVQVYDFLYVEDRFYLIQEFVPGSSLRDLLNRQGVPNVAQAVFLVKQVLGALDYAHRFTYLDQSDFQRTGLMHGDIKPSNLMLDQRGRLRVTDFSIVNKVLGGEGRKAVAAVYVQESEYLAPEQMRGVTPDACSDIYSLGATFYEMLTGRVPFTNWSASAALDVRRLNGEAEAQSLTQIRPDVPPQLALVIAKAIKRNPKERYASATELLRALHECEPQINSSELTSRMDTLKGALRGTVPNEMLPLPTPPITLPAGLPRPPQQALRPVTQSAPPVVKPQLLPPDLPAPNQVSWVEPRRRNSAAFANQPTSALPRAIPVNVAPPQFAEISKPRREWWLIPFAIASLLIGTLAGAYFFSSPSSNEGRASDMTRHDLAQQAATTPATVLASEPAETLPAATPPRAVQTLPSPKPASAIPNTPALNLARQAEQQERYSEAIRAYEEFLAVNPSVPFAAARAHVANLRLFQGILTNARAALAEARFSEAQQRFAEALKLRPTSKLAQTGWREAHARLTSTANTPLISPVSVKQEINKEPARELKGEVREDLGEKAPDAAARPRSSLPKPTPTPQP
ncbi:MAG: protein kinase [Acidobacteria bacterium]|nr:protein kinase [Acidobacteriota bacterium]MBI3427522.1 protein kinase [Acidobacteriota bacterium]